MATSPPIPSPGDTVTLRAHDSHYETRFCSLFYGLVTAGPDTDHVWYREIRRDGSMAAHSVGRPVAGFLNDREPVR